MTTARPTSIAAIALAGLVLASCGGGPMSSFADESKFIKSIFSAGSCAENEKEGAFRQTLCRLGTTYAHVIEYEGGKLEIFATFHEARSNQGFLPIMSLYRRYDPDSKSVDDCLSGRSVSKREPYYISCSGGPPQSGDGKAEMSIMIVKQ